MKERRALTNIIKWMRMMNEKTNNIEVKELTGRKRNVDKCFKMNELNEWEVNKYYRNVKRK